MPVIHHEIYIQDPNESDPDGYSVIGCGREVVEVRSTELSQVTCKPCLRRATQPPVDVLAWQWYAAQLEQVIIWMKANPSGQPTLPKRPTSLVCNGGGLRDFAKAMVDISFQGGDADGAHIQELALKHGLLTPEVRTKPCKGSCACAEYGFPANCNRKTALLKPVERDTQDV